MCGIFGAYVGTWNNSINLAQVARHAQEMESRGRDAWGIAWIDRRGRIRSVKNPGAITSKTSDALAIIQSLDDPIAIIGHTRASTGGDPGNNVNNHPHPCNGGWIVHNGYLIGSDDRELARKHGLHLSSSCDTEVIARLIEHSDASAIRERVKWAIEETKRGPLALACLWRSRIVLARRGNPLHSIEHKGTIYFASTIGSAANAFNCTVHELTPNHVQEFKLASASAPAVMIGHPVPVAEAEVSAWTFPRSESGTWCARSVADRLFGAEADDSIEMADAAALDVLDRQSRKSDRLSALIDKEDMLIEHRSALADAIHAARSRLRSAELANDAEWAHRVKKTINEYERAIELHNREILQTGEAIAKLKRGAGRKARRKTKTSANLAAVDATGKKVDR